MSEIDDCIGHWERVNCPTDLSLSTSLADACVPVIKLPDWNVHELCFVQGTSKVLHPKPNTLVRSAWTAASPVRKTTTPCKFIKPRKTPPCTRNRNNCRTVDKDFKYSVSVRKTANQQRTTGNVKECQLPQCNSRTEERVDEASSRDKILVMGIQVKEDCVVSNSNSVPRHIESPEIENNQGITIVELFPGVKSYIIGTSSKDQTNENEAENNETKLEEQLFCTLKDCPDPADDSDDETSVSWYRNIVQQESEKYLKRLSKRCDQVNDAARQSPSSRQTPQHLSSAKATDSDHVQEMTESRRISRTARYVSYILWKKSLGKSKVETPKVWKPPG